MWCIYLVFLQGQTHGVIWDRSRNGTFSFLCQDRQSCTISSTASCRREATLDSEAVWVSIKINTSLYFNKFDTSDRIESWYRLALRCPLASSLYEMMTMFSSIFWSIHENCNCSLPCLKSANRIADRMPNLCLLIQRSWFHWKRI